ncbi:hypothetical protein JW948_08875 [bacterium]|nr:hypothetical protein [bacterium]
MTGGGENKRYGGELKEIENTLKEAEFPFELTIIDGMGHDFPEDFPERLDGILEKINETYFINR